MHNHSRLQEAPRTDWSSALVGFGGGRGPRLQKVSRVIRFRSDLEVMSLPEVMSFLGHWARWWLCLTITNHLHMSLIQTQFFPNPFTQEQLTAAYASPTGMIRVSDIKRYPEIFNRRSPIIINLYCNNKYFLQIIGLKHANLSLIHWLDEVLAGRQTTLIFSQSSWMELKFFKDCVPFFLG